MIAAVFFDCLIYKWITLKAFSLIFIKKLFNRHKNISKFFLSHFPWILLNIYKFSAPSIYYMMINSLMPHLRRSSHSYNNYVYHFKQQVSVHWKVEFYIGNLHTLSTIIKWRSYLHVMLRKVCQLLISVNATSLFEWLTY
jgi:hypothetical protein